MFAATGTPLVAVADGTITQKVENSISGLGVEIQDAGGTQYFYAHLSAFATGLTLGQSVATGQVIGYVGNTGDAAATSPHLHFEVQPNAIPVPPIPYVNRWLDEAENRAFLLLEQNFAYAITPADLQEWEQKAQALAGTAPLGQEGNPSASPPGPSGTGGPPSPGTSLDGGSTGVDPVAAAPMVAFAAIALLLVVIAPGIRAGRRDARRALRIAEG